VIDNINPFKNLIALSNELSAIRLQKDYLFQCEKNNALIDELSKELKALVIVQNELKNDRERFIKKDNISINKIDEIDKNLELLSKKRFKINNYIENEKTILFSNL
jgi:hypothetical protein